MDEAGLVLLLGAGRTPVRLSWPLLEGIGPLLADGRWKRIASTFSVDGEPDTLDGHLKRHIKTATAGWVAVVLETAGLVEIDRTPPARVRVATRQ